MHSRSRAALASLILTLVTMIWLPKAMAQVPIVGLVTNVKDGDTLCVGQVEIRLEGIDAPESDENCQRGAARWKCGKTAAQALRDLVAGRILTCRPKYCDPRGRTVAPVRDGGRRPR
jgi:endonuclease YncB( thermonuclease family)